MLGNEILYVHCTYKETGPFGRWEIGSCAMRRRRHFAVSGHFNQCHSLNPIRYFALAHFFSADPSLITSYYWQFGWNCCRGRRQNERL